MLPLSDADAHVSVILDAIRRIVQALRQSSRRAEHDLGLSGAQLFVLRKLAEEESSLSLGQLAERTMTHLSSVSVVVGRLVERGLVTRAPSSEDARRAEIRLSDEGLAFLKQASPVTAQEHLTQAIANLPGERRALLATLLSEVIAAAGFTGEDVPMFFEDDGKTSSRAQGRVAHV